MDGACSKFRGYLHKSGVNDAFVVALTELYRKDERPFNPTEFIRQNMPPAQDESIASLTEELEKLEEEIASLRKMIPEDRLPKRRDKTETAETMSNAFQSGSQFSTEHRTDDGALPNDGEVNGDSVQQAIVAESTKADVVSQKSADVNADMAISENAEPEVKIEDDAKSIEISKEEEIPKEEKEIPKEEETNSEVKLDEKLEGTGTVAEKMNNNENELVKPDAILEEKR